MKINIKLVRQPSSSPTHHSLNPIDVNNAVKAISAELNGANVKQDALRNEPASLKSLMDAN
jgi:hypothetical protein